MARTTVVAAGAGHAASKVASEVLRARYDRATDHLEPPLAIVDLDAFDRNAADMVRRAAGRPIRVASKSLRCRYLVERALKIPGFQGVMCYTLPEALWLHAAGTSDDLLVAYPTVSANALRALVTDDAARRHITIMVDSLAHLDAIGRVLGGGHPEVRICLDLDVSWRPIANKPLLHIGTWRSPLRTPQQAAEFAKAVTLRKGLSLVGLMGYEGQIAGIANAPPGHPVKGLVVRLIQDRSVKELSKRRGEAINMVQAVTSLEFANGGGTGSLETTTHDASVTELAAGSGLIGPALFDGYRTFSPRPALLYALPVVRRPENNIATLYSGGYLASGTGTMDRLPQPYLPDGLRLTSTEGAGEVQTPVRGAAANDLKPGDRVWMRHAKAGELAERFAQYHLIHDDDQITAVPTYRGEGQCFG